MNIRGRVSTIGGFRQEKWFEIYNLINSHRIALLAVQESHLTDELARDVNSAFDGKMKVFYSPLPDNNNAAGVAMVVNRGLLNASEITCETIVPGRAILASIPRPSGTTLNVLNVYAPNEARRNEEFWTELDGSLENPPQRRPNIMLGDFNLVEDGLDRLPYHLDDPNAVAALGNLKANLDLVDGWRRTNPDKRAYTHLHAPNASQGRIDRIYISNELLRPATEWKITNPPIETDHWVVSVKVSTPEAPHIGKGRWQIPTYIIDHQGVLEEINSISKTALEEMEATRYRRTLTRNPQTIFAAFKAKTISLCRAHARRIHPTITNKIKKQKAKLDAILNDPLIPDDDKMLESITIKTNILELERILFESSRTYAKARHHVHAETICKDWIRSNRAKKPRDTIYRLYNPLDEARQPETDSTQMAQRAKEYHEHLQRKDRDPTQDPDPAKLDQILENITARTTPGQKSKLANYISWGDAHRALTESGNDKAAGLDGIPTEMWKRMSARYDAFADQPANPYCDIVGMLTRVFNDVEEHGIAPDTNFNEGWMCPIYKKGERDNVANYRPITVLNTDYKIMTKALANKLAEAAPTLIHGDQAGFMKNRSIYDQVKLAKLTIDLGRILGRNGMIVALDQEKAYDKILHPYLWRVLERFGLPNHFIRTVKHLYKGARTSVLVNGILSDPYIVLRGVRQGDALSCLLFNLGIEPLAAALRNSPSQGIKVRDSPENIKCRLFADDTTVYLCESDDLETIEEHALTPWCEVSGAVFNTSKTEIIPVGTEEYRRNLIETRRTHPDSPQIPPNVKIAREGQPVRILGAWIGNGVDQGTPWTPTIEKIATALKKWEANHPTMEGRRLISQMIIGGMTQYLAKVQGIPEPAMKTLDKLIRDFTWSGENRPTVSMAHISNDIALGGRKALDIHARNDAIQLTWVQSYLKLGKERPTWALVADEIFANDVPGEPKSLTDDHNARSNQFLQAWKSRRNRREPREPADGEPKDIPKDLKDLVKTAKKYGVRLEAITPDRQTRELLPATRCKQTKEPNKPDTLCDKLGKCLRNKHNVRNLGDAARISENVPRQHKNNKRCRCTRCCEIRLATNNACKHPNKCIERAKRLSESIQDKWSPTKDLHPDFFTAPTPDELGPEYDPITKETAYTVNPFRVEESLEGCFRVFTTNDPPPHQVAERAPRTADFDLPPLTVYTDGSCLNNGESTAKAGSGVWFGENDTRNAALKTPGPDQSNQTGELYAVLHALSNAPKDRALVIRTDSNYVITGLTSQLSKWEDQGWIHSKHANLFKAITAWTRFRSNTTKLIWVKGHSGTRGNDEADRLAREGAEKDPTDLDPSTNAPENTVPSGAKLSALSQKDLYRGIKIANRPPPRRSSDIIVGRIQACASGSYGSSPTPERVWLSTRHRDLSKKTREFIWKSIHDAFKIGKFWDRIEGYEHRGVCRICESEESMEHILTECTAPGRTQVWALANELWKKRSNTPIPESYGALLGCCLSEFKTPGGKPDKGLNRLFRILVSESMYVIWRTRCERVITWGNDPSKSHSPHEIHNKWLQAINARLRMDSVQTNQKIFKDKALLAKTVLKTWEGCLKDNLHETRNWCGKTGVLVGIAPRRPPGRNR